MMVGGDTVSHANYRVRTGGGEDLAAQDIFLRSGRAMVSNLSYG